MTEFVLVIYKGITTHPCSNVVSLNFLEQFNYIGPTCIKNQLPQTSITHMHSMKWFIEFQSTDNCFLFCFVFVVFLWLCLNDSCHMIEFLSIIGWHFVARITVCVDDKQIENSSTLLVSFVNKMVTWKYTKAPLVIFGKPSFQIACLSFSIHIVSKTAVGQWPEIMPV